MDDLENIKLEGNKINLKELSIEELNDLLKKVNEKQNQLKQEINQKINQLD